MRNRRNRRLSRYGDCVAQRMEADRALAALRAMVAIADATVAGVTGELTLTQFRALRVVTDRTPVTMSRVARELAMNPSSVTRACDRLSALDLLQRAPNPLNRREILLAPTSKGRQVVDRVDHGRRQALEAVLGRLEPARRYAVAEALADFAAAARQALDDPS
jgi:DNA-binding MarR family transcriptional regulator